MSFDLSDQALIKTVVKVTQGTTTKKLEADWDCAIEHIDGESIREQAKRALINLYGIKDKGVELDPKEAAAKAWGSTWLADALTGAFNDMRDRNFRQGKSA
jgi:hypothetical protein